LPAHRLRYVSTRGQAPVLDFEDVLLTGLARDGGLYVPETWPQIDHDELTALVGRPYGEAAMRVIRPFIGGAIGDRDLGAMIEDAYRGFAHKAVAPLVHLGPGEFLLELFHGPTLAFKDFALQLLGRLFDHVLSKRGKRVVIVGATSGDTGSAAIEAFRGRAASDVFILHPKGRVSEVQRRQMTTVLDQNIRNIAVEGTFDDCQALVKAMFNDAAFRDEFSLSAVNSINWARIMAQVVYYVTSALELGAPARKVAYVVPTGNFGDVYAGYVAKRMGLPIERLIVATNANDILRRFFETGRYAQGRVQPTTSPSMDIQVSSNFERLLFDLCRRDGAEVAALMRLFDRDKAIEVGGNVLGVARAEFAAGRAKEDEVRATIAAVRRETGYVLDPHSAVGVAVGRKTARDPGTPLVALATAHPAKFPDAVEAAIGARPALPPRLADLPSRPERLSELPNDLRAIQDHIRRELGGAGGRR